MVYVYIFLAFQFTAVFHLLTLWIIGKNKGLTPKEITYGFGPTLYTSITEQTTFKVGIILWGTGISFHKKVEGDFEEVEIDQLNLNTRGLFRLLPGVIITIPGIVLLNMYASSAALVIASFIIANGVLNLYQGIVLLLASLVGEKIYVAAYALVFLTGIGALVYFVIYPQILVEYCLRFFT
ncbi:hypothetical protein BKI52_32560 [marine bacterium AO1-C]|nr:hypothetical protein BKI52_32560 [marine bacterium AO1-C]